MSTEDFFCEHNVNAVVAWGKLYKKELFREIRYPVGKLHEDEFTTYKLLFQYENCAFVNQPLYSYFINNAGITKVSWTTRRLDAFEAFDNQLSFFKENRFKKAYAKVLDSIAYTCSIHIKAIDNDYENRHYKCLLRKKLSKHLKKYKNQVGFSIKKTPMYYEYAYPTLMKYYWLIISQIKKQKGKKNV